MNIDEINYSLQHLKHKKLRSFLNTLSITIGVSAIFALISFGLGIQAYVDRLAEESGTDKLFLQAAGISAPGTDTNFLIKKNEVDFVGKINGVKEISGIYTKPGEIKHGKEKKFNYVMGIDASKIDFISEAITIDVISGRNLKDTDALKAVLGYNYQFEDKIFKNPVRLGDKIEINGNEVEVVGFWEEVGNPSDDAQVYLTYKGMELIFPDTKDKFGFVMLKSEKGVDVEQLAARIKDKLRSFKGQEKGKEDFYVQTFADVLQTFGTILVVINGVLVLIALVSIVVASVNIMNTMYTAVLERTKEIGVMKSIGARRRDIIFIFMFEAGFLGALGGVIGVILGYMIASFGGGIAASSGFALLQPVFPLSLVVGCVLFAFFVGAGAGLLPAVQASKLKPVDALRYE